MLRIRDDQMNVLRRPALEDFIDDMVLHVHEHFAEEAAQLGIASVRERVEQGIRSAEGHGVVSPRGVCKYLNLMMTFGPDFDTNPRTAPWVQPILNDITVPDPTARMDVLSDKALSVVKQAEGAAVDPAEELENMRSA
jgi:hypothetical protein